MNTITMKNVLYSAIIMTSVVMHSSAFTVSTRPSFKCTQKLPLYSTVDGTVDVDPPTPGPSSAFLTTALSNPSPFSGPQSRRQFNDQLLSLESTNVVDSPVSSPLLPGTYELRYIGNYEPGLANFSPTRQLALFLYAGGYSPGALLLQSLSTGPLSKIAKEPPLVKVTISESDGVLTSTASLNIDAGVASADLKIESSLEKVSDRCIKETYSRFTASDRDFALPDFAKYTRDLFITYLDDDILVVRDGTGVPEVLVRVNDPTPEVFTGDDLDLDFDTDSELPATD